jgi:16S rRNA (uracil1498-N3)-methyltransferase
VARALILEQSLVRILSVAHVAAADCHLTLIQGLPKGEKMELVLQKGTELGVSHFLPTQMERSVGRLKAEREKKRFGRWEKIIQEAARQSAQPYLPQLQIEHSLESALSSVDADLKLLLWEESGQPLNQVLPGIPPQRVAVIVGPEGGVSAKEAQLAERAGYLPVSIGPRILRTETAGLAIMAILQYLYGDLANGRCSSDTVFQGKDES